MPSVTDSDIQLAKDRFPGLDYANKLDVHTFTGPFVVHGVFDIESSQYTFGKDATGNRLIHDQYEVRIEIPENATAKVFETGGRIPIGADHHKYESGEVCAWGLLDVPNAVEEIIDMTAQFFFDQSYFARYGIWPRDTFSHGPEGLLENYYYLLRRGIDRSEDTIRLLQQIDLGNHYNEVVEDKYRIKGHRLCLCESGEISRRCHVDSFRGLWHLQNRIRDESKSIVCSCQVCKLMVS